MNKNQRTLNLIYIIAQSLVVVNRISTISNFFRSNPYLFFEKYNDGGISPAVVSYSVSVSIAICIPSLKAYSKMAASAKLIYREDGGKRSYAEVMAEKKAKCYAMIDDACLEVMSSSEKLNEYLMVQSSFERYSLNNKLLIFAQHPGASKLKDFDGWKKAGAYVKKGSESIMILEPSPYKGTDGKPHTG